MSFEPLCEIDEEVTDEEYNELDEIAVLASNRSEAMGVFKRLGIGLVRVNFSGSGDSGDIEDGFDIQGLAEACDPNELRVDATLRAVRRFAVFEGGKIKHTEKGEDIPTRTLNEFIMAFARELLVRAPFDYVNNEGGNGTIEILPGKDQVLIHFDQNIQSTERYEYRA